jgi:hypothetical protein
MRKCSLIQNYQPHTEYVNVTKPDESLAEFTAEYENYWAVALRVNPTKFRILKTEN